MGVESKSLRLSILIIVGLIFFASFPTLGDNGNDILIVSSSSEKGPGQKATKNFLRYASPLHALNVKLMPALYWNTLGLEIEFPATDFLSIGANLIGKLGRTDSEKKPFKIRPESYQDPAYRVELAVKYYISQSAPTGFYAQVNFSYGNLLYFDGTNKPFTLHSKWKTFQGGLRAPSPLDPPKDMSLGIGGGYQLVIIPKHIIANIMVGSQMYFDSAGQLYPSLYLQPSIGYVF